MSRQTRDLKNIVKIVEKLNTKDDNWRLSFHLMPPTGWLNDPNGLCEFKGEYHVFFQYAPFNQTGGMNFWGHYKTKDFVNWEYLEPALCSDQSFDCHGVYSGSCLVEDNKMYLYYTGNVKKLGDYDYIPEGREHNKVLASSDDGINFKKVKVLMQNKDYPKTMTCHVRDPKVWKEKDEYFMVLGARDKNDIGQVLLFYSNDKLNWKLKNIIKSKEKFGYMWECPDLFKINNQTVLIVSPQGLNAEGIKYNNIYQSGYFIINGDFKNNYELSEFEELDRGFDFYAPQTFEDTKGRRILIAWLGLPDIDDLYINPTVNYNWQHALTIPRIISINDNKIIQNPIEEIKNLREKNQHYKINNNLCINNCTIFELIINIEQLNKIEIKIRDCALIEYNKKSKIFSLSFIDGGYGRTKRSVQLNLLNNLRVFCDASSIEIFINDGYEVFTSRFYPTSEQTGLHIKGDNLTGTLNIWKLKKFNIANI